MLTDLQQDEVRDVMLLNLDSVTNATQLAELAASLLDLEEELDDPDSELWESRRKKELVRFPKPI